MKCYRRQRPGSGWGGDLCNIQYSTSLPQARLRRVSRLMDRRRGGLSLRVRSAIGGARGPIAIVWLEVNVDEQALQTGDVLDIRASTLVGLECD